MGANNQFFRNRRGFSVASSSLGRFSKSMGRLVNDHEREDHYRTTQTLPRNLHSGGQHARSRRQPPAPKPTQVITTPTNQSRQYGSMINISIRNTITPPKFAVQNNVQPPAKPERTYRSSLSRSKSFNVEAGRNGTDTPPPRIPYTSTLQLNRLDETPPLKSPGILASISRSNRDLLRDTRREH